MDGMELCLLLSRVVVDTKVVPILMSSSPDGHFKPSMSEWSLESWYIQCPQCSGTSNRDECPTWLGILETSVICLFTPW